MTEDEMVAGCRRGDRDAQRELYARTSKRIYSLLRRMTRNAEDARDLTQDTYVRVFQRVGEFRGGCRITSWVYRIAINEALQLIRRNKQRAGIIPEVAKSVVIPAPQDSQDVQMDVGLALDLLCDNDRSLIVLRYLHGLSYAEIGEVLDKPTGTVASGLNRARQILRSILRQGSAPSAEETPNPEHLI